MSTPNSQVITQFGFKVKQGFQPLPGLITEKVVIHEKLNCPAVWTYFISSAYIKVFNDTFHDLLLTSTPRVFVRLGTSAAGKVSWQPWQEHLILGLSASPKPNSHAFVMRTADRFAEMRRATPKTSWQGLISSIVGQFASAYQLTPVVEPTAGQFSLIQTQASDHDFLVGRLMARAITPAGRGDFCSYVRDQELHFHTTGYKKTPVAVRFFFDSSTEITHMDRTQENVYAGAAGLKSYIFDPYTGAVSTRLTSPSGLVLGKHRPDLSGIVNGPVTTSWTVGVNQFDEAIKLAQSRFDTVHLSNYVIKLKTVQLLLRIDDLVDLDLTQSTREFNPWSGRYSVSEVSHSIAVGTVTSQVTMTRGDVN